MHGAGEPQPVHYEGIEKPWYRTDCTDPDCDFHTVSSSRSKSEQRVRTHVDGANAIEEKS